jgi:EAL domain-containing protein (putative c-di-GMP-specific phosphodiesterase class I)
VRAPAVAILNNHTAGLFTPPVLLADSMMGSMNDDAYDDLDPPLPGIGVLPDLPAQPLGVVTTMGGVIERQVMAHLRDAVLLVDADGVIGYASPNTLAILDAEPGELLGEHVLDCFDPPDVGAIERAMDRSPDAVRDTGSLLLCGTDGPLTVFSDVPAGLGPAGTRLLTFRAAMPVPAMPVDAEADYDEFGDVQFGEPKPQSLVGAATTSSILAKVAPMAVSPSTGVGDADQEIDEMLASLADQIVPSPDATDEEIAELATAIEFGQIVAHYQPEIDLETGSTIGAEALARWNHPERGEIPAYEFIELAETAGLIRDLGRQVIMQACANFGDWARRFGNTAMILRINLSADQLADPTIVDTVKQAMAEGQLLPASLCLEVTETALMIDPAALDYLEAFQSMGIRIAVDDFGTGYSSLSQLKRLPVDVLKIDRSFVDGLGQSTEDTAIVRAIVDLARAIGLGVVAEGIEHPRQVDELLRLGVRRGQGWMYGKAVPWAQLESDYLLV